MEDKAEFNFTIRCHVNLRIARTTANYLIPSPRGKNTLFEYQ
jgi:hypothetical protein